MTKYILQKSTRFLFLASLWLCSVGYAQSPLRLYIACDDHTDYLWSGTEDEYKRWFVEMLDYYIDLADQTKNEPPDFQSRFSADGNLWLWTYQKNKPANDFNRLIEKMRSGHITVPKQTLVPLYGAMPTEAVLRGMYYMGRIERAYNLEMPIAVMMENQTMPMGIASLWAGSGVKYSWKGVCACATRLKGFESRPREIYYALGPDGNGVLMKWNSLLYNQSAGGYAEAFDPAHAVDVMSNPQFDTKWKWSARALFGRGWDNQKTLTNEFVTIAKTKSNASRRVIVSNELDFFHDFEQSAPAQATIPSYSASFGNEWDLIPASMSEVTARVRRAVEELRTAEALATIVSLHDPTFTKQFAASADSAFMHMELYFDHDWTMDGPASAGRQAFQRRLASQIEKYVAVLKQKSLARLGAYVKNPTHAERFVVFNPLGWKRTDVVDLRKYYSKDFHVIDVATGTEVPCGPAYGGGANDTRIVAHDVPAVGYKVYEIVQGEPYQLDSVLSTKDMRTFEHTSFTMELDEWQIKTLTTKDASPVQLVGETGPINQHIWNQFHSSWNIQSDVRSGAFGLGNVTAVFLHGKEGDIGYQNLLMIHRDVDRIEIDNRITGKYGGQISYDFGFNLSNFTVRHEEVGAIATAKRVSEGGSYSNELARTDWLTLGHFVDISDDNHGVTIASLDGSYFQLGNSTVDSLDTKTPILRLLAGARFDNLGAFDQGGDTDFRKRFAIWPHGKFDQAASMRMAMEFTNPLVSTPAVGTSPKLPEDKYSLISVNDSSVLLWALKPSEEGIDDGIIARVWNLADEPATCTISFPGRDIKSAHYATHIETNTGLASHDSRAMKDRLSKQQLGTYRFSLADAVNSIGYKTEAREDRILLFQNSPNPFTQQTTIEYELKARGHVTLQLFDLLGRRVAALDAGEREAGRHVISITRSDAARLIPGVYYYTLSALGRIATRKLVVGRW